MSTHALIGYQHEDGSVSATYVHMDGYPANTGNALLRHYAKTSAKLIAEGESLSHILAGGAIIRMPEPWPSERYVSTEAFLDGAAENGTYAYLWANEKWTCYRLKVERDGKVARVDEEIALPSNIS